MNSIIEGTQVLELALDGLPPTFTECQLKKLAGRVVSDLADLLDAGTVLHRTRLAHAFRIRVDERGRAQLSVVIGLAMTNQLFLQLLDGDSPDSIEEQILADREQLVLACRTLPAHTTLAAIELAQRAVAACLQLPVVPGEVSRTLQALLNVRRRRRFNGRLTDRHWQAEIPAVAKYDWLAGCFDVRAELRRERCAFTLVLRQRDKLAPELRGSRTLQMLQRPADIAAAMALEEAEFRRNPVDLTIRVGSRVGRREPSVADFVALR